MRVITKFEVLKQLELEDFVRYGRLFFEKYKSDDELIKKLKEHYPNEKPFKNALLKVTGINLYV